MPETPLGYPPPVARGGLTLEIVSDEAGFRAFTDEWDDLAGRAGPIAGFARHCFVFESWVQQRRLRGVSLHIAVIRSAGRAVVAAPMFLRPNSAGFATLEWLGGRVPVYRELLCDPAWPRDRLFRLLEKHIRSLRRIRKLAADNVADESVLADFLQGLGASRSLELPGFSFDLTQYVDWNAFLSSRSRNSRYYHRRNLRLLEEIGPVVFETVTDPGGLAHDIEWLIEEKRAWVRKSYGPDGWVFDPAVLLSFQRTAQACAATGRAWILKLRCGDRTVAATLNYRFKDTDFPILIAQDQAWNAYSPGWLLTMEVYRQAFAQGIRRVDLMRGANPQKKRMANETRMVSNYKLYIGIGRLI